MFNFCGIFRYVDCSTYVDNSAVSLYNRRGLQTTVSVSEEEEEEVDNFDSADSVKNPIDIMFLSV